MLCFWDPRHFLALHALGRERLVSGLSLRPHARKMFVRYGTKPDPTEKRLRILDMRNPIALFATGTLVSLNSSFAVANKADRSGGACLRPSEIRDLRAPADLMSLLVQDNARKVYRVRLDGPCYFLSERLAVRFVDFAQNCLAYLTCGDGASKASTLAKPRVARSNASSTSTRVRERLARIRLANRLLHPQPAPRESKGGA
jgi:hypothetical protein